MKKKIALTWGWTGWHVFPLISIYNSLKRSKNIEFIWIWEEDSLEEEIAEKYKIEFHDIASWKIRRYFDWRNFYEPLKNLTWIFQWLYYILKYKIDLVFSKWGFVSLPLCIAAFILRKPIYIHESDTTTWLSNKLIWKIATKIFYTFPNNLIDWEKHILTWQILNPELLEVDIIETPEPPKQESFFSKKTIDKEKIDVLVIAWSQGSKIIFENLISVLNNLLDLNFTIILWDKNQNFKQQFEKFSNVKTYDFVTQKELANLYQISDIAITRWWATTLWELFFFWIHSIIIPLSNSAWNHQQLNAEYFHKNFWFDILDENKNDFNMDLFRLLIKYKDLRKNWLNLKWFTRATDIIKEELKK